MNRLVVAVGEITTWLGFGQQATDCIFLLHSGDDRVVLFSTPCVFVF